ncbi:hypothetical protein EDC01DRAFT_664378 [Geopyxis carbonaria]|nr:hypothetical protein EDC01DRAFT_664378 [Geopyxis carbonaria]
MFFSISSSLLLLSTLAAALPALEKRQSRSLRSAPVEVLKLYEHSPNVVIGQDGWGETSRVGSGLSGVNTLIAFQTYPEDFGKTCNLRFAAPSVQSGSKSFTLWSFVPSNGNIFDPHRATWNQKTGYRDRQLATHTYVLNGPDIVYSLPCPAGGKFLNYELTSANGESNMQWYTPNGEGLYLEVAVPVKPPTAPTTPRRPIPIPSRDQAQMFESRPTSGSGSIQYGDVSSTAVGIQTTTLVAYVMPDSPNYAARTCRLRFSNPTATSGSRSFALFEFVPHDGRQIFRSDTASWNAKGGYRNRQLALHKVEGSAAATVYTFPCPAPGVGLNYELVPTGGEGRVTWNTAATPAGGLALEVV